MFRIFKTPLFLRLFLKNAIFHIPNSENLLYLTFDDGPIPKVTPWVMEQLDKFGAKATFFCVGENAIKHTEIKNTLLEKGHQLGNHTYHHLKGWNTSSERYYQDIEDCSNQIKSNLFRPPYGRIRFSQYQKLKKKYKIILWDLISYDFDPKLDPKYCLQMLKGKTRSGSIVVFHDSQKSFRILIEVLPAYLEFCIKQGYRFGVIPN